MSTTNARLDLRSTERLQRMAESQNIVLLVVAVVVLGNIAAHVAAVYLLMADNIQGYRTFQMVFAALSAMLDLLFLVLVYILFAEIHRGQREAERLQTFMDTVYRRGL